MKLLELRELKSDTILNNSYYLFYYLEPDYLKKKYSSSKWFLGFYDPISKNFISNKLIIERTYITHFLEVGSNPEGLITLKMSSYLSDILSRLGHLKEYINDVKKFTDNFE